jgi:casein kinase II subunit beta
VQYYQYALELITDVLDVDCDDDMREQIEKSARHLYGLIHARFIITTRGLGKMVRIFALTSICMNKLTSETTAGEIQER